MKALALIVGVVLMAGVVAVADDHPRLVNANDAGPDRQDPFSNRSYADVVTSVSEAPTGRFMVGVRTKKAPKSQDRQLEQRLEAIEKQLDRVLKELENLKGTTKPTK